MYETHSTRTTWKKPYLAKVIFPEFMESQHSPPQDIVIIAHDIGHLMAMLWLFHPGLVTVTATGI